ncbi:protein kinase domain protein [Ichthyophthirius multifiliis]|uniref:Protein kinase domain protein n=1 Tax=Ichthyophthirius multifiliis TaxID=5932 RepID=G0QSN7_ICHMU|nr:protein kinase domain protein [Ichthyophthirius multifiliis]EGR31753.1 protein kinase domain protein [Ichthyophthirius multifiliis]|eukprot:XP_004035239.1 protein kinase domain protein [Ichthyophthirius multifiliis]
MKVKTAILLQIIYNNKQIKLIRILQNQDKEIINNNNNTLANNLVFNKIINNNQKKNISNFLNLQVKVFLELYIWLGIFFFIIIKQKYLIEIKKKLRNIKSQNINALKVIEKKIINQNNMLQQLQRELNIQFNFCKHKNILQCNGYFEDDNYFYIVLEYANDGNLAQLLQKSQNNFLQEKNSAKIIQQLCEAINYLHNQNIIHRDLKLENILIQNGTIKLCDFGCAAFSDVNGNIRRKSFCGTIDYVAPEMIDGQIYDKEIDVWALGVICYELNSGYPPFSKNTEKETFDAIQRVQFLSFFQKENNLYINLILNNYFIKKLDINYPNHFSQNLINFLQQIFVVNKNQRCTIQELLQHQWLLKFQQN